MHGPPGPLAQAITFRAFGAETRSFNAGSLPSIFLSSAYCLLPPAYFFYGLTMPWLPTDMTALPYFILINLAGPSL